MSLQETALGFYQEFASHFIFFGKKNATHKNICREFPAIKFIRMKQTHSVIHLKVNSTDDLKHNADAISTDIPYLGLCCSTADCLPILVYSAKLKTAWSIHAGWRGVANDILRHTLSELVDPSMQFYIGPHIAKDSFEVGNDVRDLILKSTTIEESYFTKIDGHKSKVNLAAVVRAQIASLGAHTDQIEILEMDTFANHKFHSFRRDKEQSGRQISFIYLK